MNPEKETKSLIKHIETLANNKGLVFIEAKQNSLGDTFIFLAKTGKQTYEGTNEYVTGAISYHDLRSSTERDYLTWYNGHYIEGLDKAVEDYNKRS